MLPTGTPETRGHPSFFSRMVALVLKPVETWKTIAEERGNAHDFSRYYLPAVLLWTSATIASYLVFGMFYPVRDGVSGEVEVIHLYPEVNSLIAHQLFYGFFSLIFPFLLAKPVTVLARFFDRETPTDVGEGEVPSESHETPTAPLLLHDARRYLIYAHAPIITASAVHAIPLLSVVSFVVALRGFYIYYTGITPILGIAERSRFRFFIAGFFLFLFFTVVLMFLSQDIVGNPFEEAVLNLQQGVEVGE
ncbi:hypothetical protein MRY87_08295 [bacterium]|nr:hypothetical protein [bacterium]